jgi:hypothetical protein
MRSHRRVRLLSGSILFGIALASCSDSPTSSSIGRQFDEVAIAEEAETLSGMATNEAGTCPDNFIPKAYESHELDFNGNGFVCVSLVSNDAVDDKLPAEGPETEFAGGHGNFADAGKKGTQNISFSFHGRQNKTMVVKGEFEMHDFANNLRIHGNVTCLTVDGRTATLGGVVDQSTDPKLPVGTAVVWQTVDNGEGINAPVDLISRPSSGGKKDPKDPSCAKVASKHILIESGNIQVLN